MRLTDIIKKAKEAGRNDATLDEIMADHAVAFIDSEVADEITDEEQELVIEAYCQGFKESI